MALIKYSPFLLHSADSPFHAETRQHKLICKDSCFFIVHFFGGGGLIRYSILINKCLTCPFEGRRKRPGNKQQKKTEQSVCFTALKSSCFPFDVPSRVPELSRRIHNCAVASLLRSVPSVRLSLILSVIPLPWSPHPPPTTTTTTTPPARCHQVPVLSGCLRFLSFSLAWLLLFFEAEYIASWCHLFETA